MKAATREIIAASPNEQKISNNTAVNVLAHMKSPRINAPTRLRTDTRAQIPEPFQVDMLAILSRL
jgi:hypothetical protein